MYLVDNYIPIYLKNAIDLSIFFVWKCAWWGNTENGVGGKEMELFLLKGKNFSKCILMVSLYIWLSIYTNNEILCIIWKFDLSSRGVLGKIYALSIEVICIFNPLVVYRFNARLYHSLRRNVIWARSCENASYVICEQQRRICSLISTFIVHCLDSMICILAIYKVWGV